MLPVSLESSAKRLIGIAVGVGGWVAVGSAVMVLVDAAVGLAAANVCSTPC
jgi:hypothetical protein